jgi:flagellin
MTVINTNVGALMARTYATKANDKMQTSMERLSSGMRINSAADDAAGLAVANKMTSQLSGIKMAIRNSQDGISLVQTAEAGMGEVTNMILRMRELAVQMENGIYTAKDRDNAQLEVNALLAEIDKIATNTRFNDVAVLDGSYDQTIRAGNTNAETIRVAVGSLKSADTAKITEFAVESGIIETGRSFGADGTPAGVTYTYNSGGGDTAVQVAMKAGYYNLSADGADGVDADGSDTDLEVQDGVAFEIDTSVFSSAFKEVFKSDSLGEFKLAAASGASVALDATTTDNTLFDIDAKTGRITSKSTTDLDFTATADATNNANNLTAAKANYYAFDVQYWQRGAAAASHTEKIHLVVKQATEVALNAIEVETTAKATRSIETLNKALEEVSTAQAKLGAIQNRLTHNIDNLSKGSMLTEQSVGRIVDADFATETSELSKQQILAQAATSMLAQANQSKQSVLALLQ